MDLVEGGRAGDVHHPAPGDALDITPGVTRRGVLRHNKGAGGLGLGRACILRGGGAGDRDHCGIGVDGAGVVPERAVDLPAV